MTSRVYTYLATGTNSDLVPISSNTTRTKVLGWSIYNSGASVCYVNFYWGNAGFGGSVGSGFYLGNDFPTVGHDSPDLSIAIPAASNAFLAPDNGIIMQGSQLYMSITTTAAQGSTASPALPAGGQYPIFTGSVAANAVLANVFYEQ